MCVFPFLDLLMLKTQKKLNLSVLSCTDFIFHLLKFLNCV